MARSSLKKTFLAISVLVFVLGLVFFVNWMQNSTRFESKIASISGSEIKDLPKKSFAYFESKKKTDSRIPKLILENLTKISSEQRLARTISREEFIKISNQISEYCYNNESPRYHACLQESLNNNSKNGSLKAAIERLPISNLVEKNFEFELVRMIWTICLKIGHFNCLDKMLEKYEKTEFSHFDVEKPILVLRTYLQFNMDTKKILKVIKAFLNQPLNFESKLAVNHAISMYYSNQKEYDLCVKWSGRNINLINSNKKESKENYFDHFVQNASCLRQMGQSSQAVQVLKSFSDRLSFLGLREKMFFNIEVVLNKILARVSLEDSDTSFRKKDFDVLNLEEETLIRSFFTSIRTMQSSHLELGVTQFLDQNGENSEYGVYFKSILSSLKPVFESMP